MSDSTLIPIWARIWELTEELSFWGTSLRFVPEVGDVLVHEYSPDVVTPLRAIFAVHGKLIEAELPEDMRETKWVELLDPECLRVRDRPSYRLARIRYHLLERLRETAMFILEKHRAAALVGNNLNARDEKRSGGVTPPKAWSPPLGYVGRKSICTLERFQKNGKNPPATTIDAWVISAAKVAQPVVIEKDPANQENYYPETWILERIATWNPRISET